MKILSHIFQVGFYDEGTALLVGHPVIQQTETYLRVINPLTQTHIAIAEITGDRIEFCEERDRLQHINDWSLLPQGTPASSFLRGARRRQVFGDIEEAFDHIPREFRSKKISVTKEGALTVVFTNEKPLNIEVIPPSALGQSENTRKAIRRALFGIEIPAPEHREARQKQNFFEKQQIREISRAPA